MKKLLISILIVLLVVLAYFAIFQGISIGSVNILSVEQIIDKNDNLTSKISEANALLKKDYPTKKENLSEEVSNLLQKKEDYFEIAKKSTEGEIKEANTEETYLLEYLWVRVGRHAKFKGVNIEMVFSSGTTGESNMQNLKFTVKGQYVGIIEFIYAIEDDSELGFKIENFKLVPSGSNLTATFNVRNIRVKQEKVSQNVNSNITALNVNTNTQNTTNKAETDTNNTTDEAETDTNNTTNEIDTNITNETIANTISEDIKNK